MYMYMIYISRYVWYVYVYAHTYICHISSVSSELVMEKQSAFHIQWLPVLVPNSCLGGWWKVNLLLEVTRM